MKKSKSSRRWLDEHFKDNFVKQAQAEGWRSRAVYKLKAIQEKDKIIKSGQVVVDLGAAPGGWCQIVKDWVGPSGRIFALDILPMEPIDGVDFIQGDFTEESILAKLMEKLGSKKIDVVLSDMAPNMAGNKAIDQPKSMYLCELALDFALSVLSKNGVFLVKVFQGEGFDAYFQQLKQQFKTVTSRKPEASRGRSREVYLLAKERKL